MKCLFIHLTLHLKKQSGVHFYTKYILHFSNIYNSQQI